MPTSSVTTAANAAIPKVIHAADCSASNRARNAASAAMAAPPSVAPTAPVPGAPEMSLAPFGVLLPQVESFSPRKETLEAWLHTPGVDAKRIDIAADFVARKEAGVKDSDIIAVAQQLHVLGTPVADRDAVFTYFGYGGLALPSNIEAFAAGTAAAAAAIAVMHTSAERAAAAVGVINDHLRRIGVPPLVGFSEGGGGNAIFDKATWTVTVNPDFAMTGGPDGPAELLRGLYHEARHAEQDFIVARYLARESTAEEIATQRGILIDVAKAAKASPLPANDDQAQLAERLLGPDSNAGPDPAWAAVKEEALKRLAAGGKLTPEEEAIRRHAEERYKSRHEESDAFTVQALTKLAQETH
jgi:hypothetical protein